MIHSISKTLLAFSALSLCLSFMRGAASGQIWDNPGGATWNNAANWNPATIPSAVGASVTFNSAASGSNLAQTASSAITLDGSKTVGSITFNNDAANSFTYTIANGSGGPLVFDASGSGPATITVNSVAGSSGNNTIAVTTTLNDTLAVTVNNVTANSASGALNLTTTMSGSGGFTKLGDGLATFGTGAKTYTGPTIISAGRLRMSQAARPSASSSVTINSGGQLTLLAAGGTFGLGVGNLNLNGSGCATGPFAVFPGAIRNETGSPTMITNPVVLQSDTLLHVEGSATGVLTLSNSVSGPGKLTFTAPNSSANQGQLVLLSANSYQGGTLVRGGTLVLSGSSASLGTGDVTVDNGASPSSIAKLSIQSGVADAIADSATLSLAGGGTPGVADQGYADLGAGVNEVVAALKLGGVIQPAGTYGSSASSATFQNDEYFSGNGIITALGPAPSPALSITSAAPNVVISWPTNASGFSLQQSSDVSDTNSWATNNTPVIVSGTNNTVAEPETNTARFYRLKK
jgi:fibronectin-binding autotransporter adhesin